MGLSNEKRLSGLYYAVENMVTHSKTLSDSNYQLVDLKKYCDQLWHSFLGRVSNSSHWIIGSSVSNTITWSSISPWALGVKHHCDDILKEESEALKSRHDPDYKEPFNAFDYFLSIEGLLSNANKEASKIFKIYSWSEQAVYYLRRYEDELLKDHEILSKNISNIQGECFKLFHGDEIYSRAYILNILCKFVYGNLYPYQKEKWDSLTTYLEKDNIHHALSRPMNDGSLKELAQMHVKLHKAEKDGKLTLPVRVGAMLILAGRSYYYDHQFKLLLQTLGKDVTPKDVKTLKGLFEADKKLKKDKDDNDIEYRKKSGESPLSIYGTDYMMD